MPDKTQVLAALLAQVQAEVDTARLTAATTRDEMTHAESRQENDKDTRAIEASYLARGQALRVEELEEVGTRLRQLRLSPPGAADTPIGPGALIEVLRDGAVTSQWYLMVPVGGGRVVTVDGVDVRAVSAAAPFGRGLIRKLEGDDATVRLPEGDVTMEILRVL